MHNGMLEGNQGFAILEDVDQGTFTRFIEWLYRGYYHAETPTQSFEFSLPSRDGTSSQSSTRSPSSDSLGAPAFGSSDPVANRSPQFERTTGYVSGATHSPSDVAVLNHAPQNLFDAPSPSELAARNRKALEDSVPQWKGPNPFSNTAIEAPCNVFRKPAASEKNKISRPSSKKAKESFVRRKYKIR